MPVMHDHRFVSTFAPGFEGIIGSLLKQTVPSAGEIRVSSGLLFFSTGARLETAASLAFCNNVFLLVQEWAGNATPFAVLVKEAGKTALLSGLSAELLTLGARSFRVRFSRENQFCSVDKPVMDAAERHIVSQTGLVPDRLDPDIEFWYMIRREGCSLFTVRLTRKQSTEKYLKQGELRPEIVQLIVALARVTVADRILLDPFAGYGSIPAQLAIVQPEAVVYASDIDAERVGDLAQRFAGERRVSVHRGDATALPFLAAGSVDLVVSDPPWGFWGGDAYAAADGIAGLYARMLREFDRLLHAGHGRAVILTGAKKEFEEAVRLSPAFGFCADITGFRTDILVNGKKSAVFVIGRKGFADGQA